MMDDYSQQWYQSRTIWLAIVAIVGAIGTMVQLGKFDQTAAGVIFLNAGIIYTRVTTTKPIAGTSAAKEVNDKITDALMKAPPPVDPRNQEHL